MPVGADGADAGAGTGLTIAGGKLPTGRVEVNRRFRIEGGAGAHFTSEGACYAYTGRIEQKVAKIAKAVGGEDAAYRDSAAGSTLRQDAVQAGWLRARVPIHEQQVLRS